MAGNWFFPVDRTIFIRLFNGTFGNAIFPDYVSTFFISINAWRSIITFKIGYISAGLFNGSNTLCCHERFYFWIDLIQDMQFIMVQRRSRIPFQTTSSLAFLKVADKVFPYYILVHQNTTYLYHGPLIYSIN